MRRRQDPTGAIFWGCWLIYAFFCLAATVAIGYAIYHFVMKFW